MKTLTNIMVYGNTMRKISSYFIVCLTVIGVVVIGQAEAETTVTLGEQAFRDGDMLIKQDYDSQQFSELSPFDGYKGNDAPSSSGGESFSESWIFRYDARDHIISSASITIGIFQHDSAFDGNQVADFSVDGCDLTSESNSLFDSHGGRKDGDRSEYNIYTLGLPLELLPHLEDGKAIFALTLHNSIKGIMTENGAGLDFSSLCIHSYIVKSGDVSGETWGPNTTYLIIDDIEVKVGTVLTIEEGTVIKFDSCGYAYRNSGRIFPSRLADLVRRARSQRCARCLSRADYGYHTIRGKGGCRCGGCPP